MYVEELLTWHKRFAKVVGNLGNMKALKKGTSATMVVGVRERRTHFGREKGWMFWSSYDFLCIVDPGNIQDLGKEMPNIMDPKMLQQLGGSANIQNMLKQVASMGGGGLGGLKGFGGFK